MISRPKLARISHQPPTAAADLPAVTEAGEKCRLAGFTLVELLIVLVILGVTVALATPQFAKGLRTLELKAGARQLVAVLRQARGRAVVEGREVELLLDRERRVYRLNGAGREYGWRGPMALRVYSAEGLPVEETTAVLRFFPDGGSSGGFIDLALEQRGYRVEVNWLTGRVTLDEAPDEAG